MVTPPNYQRLPGSFRPLTFSGFRGDGVLRGYLGNDHVLLVSQGPYVETTRHVYYEDVLAISVVGHWESKAWAWFSGVGTAASLGALASFPGSPGAQVAFGILAGLFALLGALNLWLGPSCRCRMLSPGGWRSLGLWDRWPAARRGLAVLVPRLEAVQIPLSGQAPQGEAVVAPPQEAPLPPVAASAPAPRKHHARGVLLLSGLLFLFSAGYDSLIFIPQQSWDLDLSSAFTDAAWAGACVALALALRGGRRAVAGAVAGIVAVGLQYALGAGQWMALAMVAETAKKASNELRPNIYQPGVLFCYATAILVGIAAGAIQLWASGARSKARA